MRAVTLHTFGDSQVLSLEHLPRPRTAADELLIQVKACSINPVDYKIRSGAFPVIGEEKLPIVLGRDISGTVVQCGDSVSNFRKGDDVFAYLDIEHGGYCDYVAASSRICAAKPAGLSHTKAAAVPLAALTAWQGLIEHGQLEAGQTVLIHGGAGGVGHFALQLAEWRGARVVTTVADVDFDFAKSLGADEVIDYKQTRFEDQVGNIDLVFDLIGGDVQRRSLDVLKRGGTLISTVGTEHTRLARSRGIRIANFMAQPSAAQLNVIAQLIDSNELRPRVQATYELEQAAQAQDYLEQVHVQGKVVLKIAA